MDVGLELRQARERRGLSLQRLSSTTKISPRVLQAIEACDEQQLPARVFTRSFVRSYAAEVGLEPDDTARRYLEQFEQPPVETAELPPTSPAERPDATERAGARILRGRFGTATMLALAAVGVLALTAGRLSRHTNAAVPPPAAVATAGLVPAAPPEPVATTGSAAAPATLHIAIAPTGPCWVQASDGADRLFGTLLKAGDTRAFDARSDVTLRVGDPATCVFAINGRAARAGGTAGQAVTVHITRDNYGRFLSH